MTSPAAENSTSRNVHFEPGAFAQKHARRLSMAGGALVILVAAGWLWSSSARRKEAFAAQELAQARVAAESGNLPLAASDLARLVDRFGGTRAAEQAVILLAQIRMTQGQTEAAVSVLRDFVRGRHPAFVEASAYGLMGNGLEDTGGFQEAAEAYRQASQQAELDFLKASYLLDAGRAYVLAGDSAAARQAYADVLGRFAELDQAAEARVRMAELGGAVPEPPRRTDGR